MIFLVQLKPNALANLRAPKRDLEELYSIVVVRRHVFTRSRPTSDWPLPAADTAMPQRRRWATPTMRRLADRVGPTNLAAGAIVLREVVDDDFGRGSFDRRAVDLEVHFSFPALTVQERRIDERIVEWVASAAILVNAHSSPTSSTESAHGGHGALTKAAHQCRLCARPSPRSTPDYARPAR